MFGNVNYCKFKTKIKKIKKSVDKEDSLKYYNNVADGQRYKMCV